MTVDYYSEPEPFEVKCKINGFKLSRSRPRCFEQVDPKKLKKPDSDGRTYLPEYDCPKIHREFCELGPSAESFLSFINQYGSIFTISTGITFPEKENVSHYLHEQGSLKKVLSFVDAGQKAKAIEFYNHHVALNVNYRMHLSAIKDDKFEQLLFPTNLLSFMWLKTLDEITGKENWRQCRNCPEWFSIAKSSKIRRGGTKRKRYCSDVCRVDWCRKGKST